MIWRKKSAKFGNKGITVNARQESNTNMIFYQGLQKRKAGICYTYFKVHVKTNNELLLFGPLWSIKYLIESILLPLDLRKRNIAKKLWPYFPMLISSLQV